jgi:hypothetical protein
MQNHPMSFNTVASLTTGLVSGLAAVILALPVQAQDSPGDEVIPLDTPAVTEQELFGNEGILFNTPTIIEFEFTGSDGVYQSTFGVENLATGERTPLLMEELSPKPNENLGVVLNPVTEFEFEANTPYAFYLESVYEGRSAGTIYSDDGRNPNGEQLVFFDGGMIGLAEGGTFLRWDDTGSLLLEDRDFNDFYVRAGGHIACPFDDVTPEGEDLGSTPSGQGAPLALACQK